MRLLMAIWIVAALLSPVMAAELAAATAESLLESTTDPYCGPRCVHFILEQYGIEGTSVAGFANQLAMSGDAQGVDLSSIAGLLEQHGLHTQAFRGHHGMVPQWPHPVLVHTAAAGDADGVGHYIVLLPNCTRSEGIAWDGLHGKTSVATFELSDRIAGGVLLTSSEPIDARAAPFVFTNDEIAYRTGIALSIAILVILSPAIPAICRRKPLARAAGVDSTGTE